MRPPRYRFPEGVRSTTRWMASRMVREGTVTETPEQLEAWIAQAPETREVLEIGGYGTEFTAHDLLPLLHVFVTAAGGRVPSAEPPPRPSRKPWLLGVLLLVAVLVVLAVVMALAQQRP